MSNLKDFLNYFSKEDLFLLIEDLDNLDYEKDKKELFNEIFNFNIEKIEKRLIYLREINKGE